VERVTPEQMRTAPAGRFVAGAGHAHFCAKPQLWGMVLWGSPDAVEMQALVRSLRLELDAPAERHASVVDASHLERIDPSAFEILGEYVRSEASALGRQVERLALVRPRGLEGAVVAGFFGVVTPPYPVAVFEELGEALEWLGHADALGELEKLYTAASETPPLVGALRALLADRLRDVDLADAAHALGVSLRTLQRRLGEAGTSFQDELAAARLRAAQRLLLQSDASLTTIAFDVGCASPQHFSQLFRKLTGESPSAWRDRHRG
jgi:AraC-like DNA-binding protein